MAVSLALLAASGCGARTAFHDEFDGGTVVTVDAPIRVDVPVAPPPIDVPVTPPPIDVPVVPPPPDVSFPPPDVSAPTACQRAIAVTPDVTLPNQDTTGLSGMPVPSCGPTDATGTPLWYRVVVPAHQTLTATAITDGIVRQPTVRIYASCAATSCLTGPQLPGGSLSQTAALWTNDGAAATEVFVAVAYFNASTPLRFAFVARLSDAP